MVIHPEVIVTPDCPTIKFREPKERVDLATELPRILHAQGWGCGTYFHVQFVDKERTKLLASAVFVVTEEMESLQTNEANPYQPVTKTVFNRKCVQIGDWWVAVVRRPGSEFVAQVAEKSDVGDPPPSTEVVKRRGRPPKNAVQQPA